MADAPLPEAARAFADGDVELLPSALSAADGEALVALLLARGDAPRLQRLGDGGDKALAKQARRALHLLRTRGVAAPKPGKREFRVHGPYAAVEELSMASSIDGRGERVVWLVRPAEGSFDVFEAQLSETRGLIEFKAGNAPRRDWRQHMGRALADERLGVARISDRHARQLIEEGYRRTVAAGRVAPEEFARARLDLGHWEPETTHPALALAPPLPLDEARGRLDSLHALPQLAMWIPPEEILPELDLEIGNILTSKLIVDPGQRRAQLHEAVRKVADKALGPEYRARLAGRLRETAFLLVAGGQIDEARLCTTAAALTLDEAVGADGNPFVLALFEKVVRAPAEAEPDEEPEPPTTPSGLVLP
jgi:hypothetical protein